MATQSVSFTVNVCLTDIAYFERTYRHQLHMLAYPFLERVVVVDKSDPRGIFENRVRGEWSELNQILKRLQSEGLVDRIDEVAWDDESQRYIALKYFNLGQVDAHCIDGTAVYQYLYAVDQCRGEYVLHADADMLFYCGPGRNWIEEGICWMREHPRVAIVTPSHPPRAQNLLEYVLGIMLRKMPQSQWHRSGGVTTRYFLLDRTRMQDSILPLLQSDPGEKLEESLTHTFMSKGFERHSSNDSNNWVIHPKPRNENYFRHLDELIWAVEHDVYPFRRSGRHPWDLYTYDRTIKEWLRAVKCRQRRGLV